MKCCQCDKEIDMENEDSYYYDYMDDIWCRECMREEVNRPLRNLMNDREND